jgi:23S rRNA pseudouridine1911/1915/1917 synthase
MRFKALIEEGRVTLDGATITAPSKRVKGGASVALDVPAPAPAEPEAQDIPLSVVFEDEHLIVVDKPAGLVVHPAPGNPDRTLVNALLAHCGPSLKGIGGVRRPGIVHRIDKETSGLIVAAKTERAHAGLAALFAAHDIERVYSALVWGAPRQAQGTVEGAIGRSSADRKKMAIVGHGKAAVTHWRLDRRFGPALRPWAALLRCELETGRTHQIRVHMASLGHGIVGDPLYGRRPPVAQMPAPVRAALTGAGRQMLHAGVLGFIHPITRRRLRFESALPADFAGLVARLTDEEERPVNT